MNSLKIPFLMLLLIMLKSSALFSFDYSAEQKTIAEKSFDSKFLIAEELTFLNAKSFIQTGWSQIEENIYLSGLKQKSILPNVYLGIAKRDTLIAKTLILLHAQNEKLQAIDGAYKGFYKEAAVHFNNALSLFNILKDTSEQLIVQGNLCELFIIQNRFKEALLANYGREKLLSRSGNKKTLIDILLKRVTIEIKQGNTKNAENTILKRVLAMGVNKKQEQECYLLLGKTYLQSKRYTEAKWFFIQASSLAEKRGSRIGKIKSLLLLGKVQNKVGDHALALSNILKAKYLITKPLKIFNIDIERELANTYKQLNQTQKSNIHYHIFSSLKADYVYPKN